MGLRAGFKAVADVEAGFPNISEIELGKRQVEVVSRRILYLSLENLPNIPLLPYRHP